MLQRIRSLAPVLLFMAVVILALFWRGMQNLRWGMAETLNWSAERLLSRYSIEAEENRKIRQTVASVATRILSGELSFYRGFDLLRIFENGPVFAALMISSAKRKFVDTANIEQSEKAFYEKIFGMFFQGIKRGKIPMAELKKIRDLLIEERYFYTRTNSGIIIPEKIELMRGVIAPKTLSICLETMEKAIRGQSLPEGTPVLPSETLKELISEKF